ncbi:hypothetical protein BDR05DRAFT_82052 [Suillus weaverae]|nr:hypothetical protein BDR05DRAFT_82052 [Suillus weaverae]
MLGCHYSQTLIDGRKTVVLFHIRLIGRSRVWQMTSFQRHATDRFASPSCMVARCEDFICCLCHFFQQTNHRTIGEKGAGKSSLSTETGGSTLASPGKDYNDLRGESYDECLRYRWTRRRSKITLGLSRAPIGSSTNWIDKVALICFHSQFYVGAGKVPATIVACLHKSQKQLAKKARNYDCGLCFCLYVERTLADFQRRDRSL